MRRNAMQQLYDWKEKSTRKPLIIRGARQVGKTWLMKEFAATAYKQFAYINFEDNEVMKEVFQKDFDIERILMAIQLVTGKVVDTDTLILFDELQEAPRGLTAMKYFLEKAPKADVYFSYTVPPSTSIHIFSFAKIVCGKMADASLSKIDSSS